MLSIENPPDPPRPCKLSALTSDEKEADPVALGGIQTPSFSIRDYVFGLRSKNITTNWPFPQHCLQLCVKHGVSDLLPPFEPPELVRAKCCENEVDAPQHQLTSSVAEPVVEKVDLDEHRDVLVDEVPDCIISESCSPPDELVVGCSDQAQLEVLVQEKNIVVDDILDDEVSHYDVEIESTVTTHDQIERNSAQDSELPSLIHVSKGDPEASSEVEVTEPLPVLRKPQASEKKCKLIVKLGSISAITQTEDLVSTSSAVSDPMASKVCPVCKVFASTSNTTLNAHIDQCLSSETNTKSVVTNFSKVKVKPRKKRLMVDIYATAPHCTLEDLDKRNGTTWATDLAVVLPTSEVNLEVKRPKVSLLDASTDENDGAVYVDSNGIKVRILSKFNDEQASMPKTNLKLKKHGKDFRSGKNCFASKQKRFGAKFMKMKPQSKKMTLFKLSESKIQATPEEDQNEGSHQEEEECPSPECPSQNEDSHQEQEKKNGSPSSRQWVCSKQSDPPMEPDTEEIHGGLEITCPNATSPLMETNQRESDNCFAVRSRIMKFSRSSDTVNSFPKTRSMSTLSNIADANGNGKMSPPKKRGLESKLSSRSNISSTGLMLKFSRSTGTFISSPRSKREEVCRNNLPKSSDLPDLTMRASENCQLLLTARKSSTLEENVLVRRPSFGLEASKDNKRGHHTILKKLRKRRSMTGSSNQAGEPPIDANGELHRFSENAASETVNASRKNRNSLSKFLEHGSRSIRLSSKQSNISKSEQEEERSTKGKGKNIASKMQVEAPVIADFAVTRSVEGVHVDRLCRTMSMDAHTPASSAEFAREPYSEQHMQSISGSEDQLDAVGLASLDEREANYGGRASNEVASTGSQLETEMRNRVEQTSCTDKNNDCQTDAVSIQGSSACLSSHDDAGLEFPQENSSITSSRIMSPKIDGLAIGREPSGSPVSTTSANSPSPPSGFGADHLTAEPMLSSTAMQDDLSLKQLDNLTLPSISSDDGAKETITIKRMNQEVGAGVLAKESAQLTDGQHCNCSRRENLHRESQFLRQNVISGKQNVSNLQIRPVISYFGTCSSFRADMLASPVVESPTGSISTMISSDSAVKYPTVNDFGSPSPTQSTSKPVLRLMGKNLTVASKEESLQLPSPVSDNASGPKCLSPLGFPPSSSSAYHESFAHLHPYHQHQQQQQQHLVGGPVIFSRAPTMVSHQMPLHSYGMQMGGITRAPAQAFSAAKLEQQASQKRFSEKHETSRSRYGMREVIVIDDTPDNEAVQRARFIAPASTSAPAIPASNPFMQRPLLYFPQHNQLIPKEVYCGFRPSFPVSCPRTDAIASRQGSLSQGSRPHLPNSYQFRSPTPSHLHPPLFYHETMR